jgi:8-oxo-dGTP pyrophosphatase MutT (NUDIX family)
VTGRVTIERPVRDAAALVLLYPDADGEAHLVLTLRHDGTHRHAGQVSFPGGRRDPGDDFPVGTALREAAEEVGLDAARAGVRVLGRLDPIDVRVSGFRLVPVVAVAAADPVLTPDPHEVDRIVRAPVAAILPGAPIEVVEEERDGWWLRYGAFPIAGLRVWGATARALGQLGAILGGAGDRP